MQFLRLRYLKALFEKSTIKSIYLTPEQLIVLKKIYKLNQHLLYRLRLLYRKNRSQLHKTRTKTCYRHSSDRLLNELKVSMYSHKYPNIKPVRAFRGEFSKCIRKSRELSVKELCFFLNSHRRIPSLIDKYPMIYMYYPFSKAFLEDFENGDLNLPEYCEQGLFFGIGFPTDVITSMIAEVCWANQEYGQFQQWYGDLISRTNPKYMPIYPNREDTLKLVTEHID